MYTKDEEEKNPSCQLVCFTNVRWELNLTYTNGAKLIFFLPYPRNIVENWNRPLIQPFTCYIDTFWHEHEDRQRERVEYICVCVRTCAFTYIVEHTS